VKVLDSYDVYAKSYKISNFEILVKFWHAISPDRITYVIIRQVGTYSSMCLIFQAFVVYKILIQLLPPAWYHDTSIVIWQSVVCTHMCYFCSSRLITPDQNLYFGSDNYFSNIEVKSWHCNFIVYSLCYNLIVLPWLPARELTIN